MDIDWKAVIDQLDWDAKERRRAIERGEFTIEMARCHSTVMHLTDAIVRALKIGVQAAESRDKAA